MGKLYGNIENRFQEGRNYTERDIQVGDDITMYYWSDRTCYYVTEVIDKKHIKVMQYHVCADKEKANGMGHQEWLYFKSLREMDAYTKIRHSEQMYEADEKMEAETWAFRYGKWMRELTCTDENDCTARELDSLKKNGYYKRYYNLQGKVSFGVRDYYYDWEF